jgi:SEC-C motif-containing protein
VDKKRLRDCPCHSDLRYSACCGPFHKGVQEALTPEALMRSRYAAFALGLGDYLVRTLASSHPDRERPPHELARELSRARERQRFTGLRIARADSSGDSGKVLFLARIFERGIDRSFGELSTFVREGGAWRYASGESVTVEELEKSLEAMA